MAVVLALACALLWGTADFVGGTATRRDAASTVLLVSTVVATPLVLAVAIATGDLLPASIATAWGLLAGFGACLGILSLYRGLATGVMGVVAPIASTSVIVPVIVGLVTGASIGALCVLGIAVAVVGVVLAGGPSLREFRTGGHRPLLLALGAAAGIGVSLVGFARGSATSAVTTLLASRIAYLAVLVVVVLFLRSRRTVAGPLVTARSTFVLAALAGIGDVTAVGLYGIATRSGSLPVVAALASMFPVATLVLARQIDGERLSSEQAIGVAIALVGVVVIVATQ